MKIENAAGAEEDLPETNLPPLPEYDPELESVDGEAVVVPGQRPGPTEPVRVE